MAIGVVKIMVDLIMIVNNYASKILLIQLRNVLSATLQ